MPLSILLRRASAVLFIVLGGLLAYQLALLTWSLYPVETFEYQWLAPKEVTTKSGNQIDTQKLQQQHLFGIQAQAQKIVKNQVVITEAPKTTLDLILVGVVAASEPNSSSAIISHKRKQDSYFIDSKIGETGASIIEIHEDRVILSVDGVLQTLMLDGVEKLKQQQDSLERLANSAISQVVVDSKVKQVDLDRKELLKNPGQLTDYIRISPSRQDGEVVGYSLKAGKDSTLFEQAGLQEGDIAVELNGVDLTDTQQAFSLMKDFPTMTDISLTVERDGQLHELYLSIP